MRRLLRFLPGLPICSIWLLTAAPGAAQPNFVDRAPDLGVSFTWAATFSMGDFGAGVALDDIDDDGDLDLLVGAKSNTPLQVYRNDGAVFTDISDQAGIGDAGDVKQILLADLDDDGDRDLVVGGWTLQPGSTSSFVGGWLCLYASNGDGTFSERTGGSSLEPTSAGLPTGITAGDYDRDGDLDLYVAYWKSGPAGPESANRLYRNEGNFDFNEVGSAAGVASTKKSYQAVFTDLSGDGWLDLVVAQDKGGGATYYENQRNGTFLDRSVESGLDGFRSGSNTYADGMGIAVGDYDNDGRMDVYITNIPDGNLLYHNLGGGQFEEVAAPSGTISQRIGWGTEFIDCNHDGYLDLYVTDFSGGGMSDNVDRLYLNAGDGSFSDIAPTSGLGFGDDGFASAAGDLDGNGRVDLVTLSSGAPLRVLMDEGSGGHWIHLELVGVSGNRDAVGARVRVVAGGMVQYREQRAGGSYLAFPSHELEFGLGSAGSVDTLQVDWPDGSVERWFQVNADQRLELVQGTGLVPVLTAPQLSVDGISGHAGTEGVILRWVVDLAARWTRFTLMRSLDGGVEEVAVRIEALEGRSNYSWNEPTRYSGSARSYRLVSERAGQELASSTLELAPRRFARVVEVAAPVPNPFNPRVRLRYRGQAGTRVGLRIVDPAGRTVRRFAPAGGDIGWNELVWDGTDDRGRAVAGGSYRFVVESGGRRVSAPLTLVR